MANTFLICTRGINEEGEFTAEPGDTTFLKVSASQTDYSPANIVKDTNKWKKNVISAADGDGEEDVLTGSTGDILFFCHGYNNTRDVVLWRTRTLQDTLNKAGWKGLVIGFDWPSANVTLNYIEDRMDASAVADRLVSEALQLLVDAQFPPTPGAPACKLNVHLIGHSTLRRGSQSARSSPRQSTRMARLNPICSSFLTSSSEANGSSHTGSSMLEPTSRSFGAEPPQNERKSRRRKVSKLDHKDFVLLIYCSSVTKALRLGVAEPTRNMFAVRRSQCS